MYKSGIPLVVCDIETAGLAVTDAIIQIAAIAVSTIDWKELASFEVKLQFDKEKANATALQLNHYSDIDWEKAVPAQEGLTKLSQFFGRFKSADRVSARGRGYSVAIAAGYNSSFDSERILYHSRKFNIFQAVDPRFLDVMQLAFWKQLDLDSYKLASLAEYLQVTSVGAHEALADVRMTIEVLKALLKMPE